MRHTQPVIYVRIHVVLILILTGVSFYPTGLLSDWPCFPCVTLPGELFPQVPKLVGGDQDTLLYMHLWLKWLSKSLKMDQHLYKKCVICIQVHSGEDVKCYLFIFLFWCFFFIYYYFLVDGGRGVDSMVLGEVIISHLSLRSYRLVCVGMQTVQLNKYKWLSGVVLHFEVSNLSDFFPGFYRMAELSFAVTCSSNMNRSMEAHAFLRWVMTHTCKPVCVCFNLCVYVLTCCVCGWFMVISSTRQFAHETFRHM